MKNLKIITLVFGLSILFSNCTRINPGYAGFKISYSGNYKGTDSIPLQTGWVAFMPGFSTVVEFPTFMQHHAWTVSKDEQDAANEEISIGCKGGAGFLLDIGLNYTILPNKASHIYFKFKTDDLDALTDGYIRNSTRKVLNDLAGTYTVDSFLTNRPQFEKTAEENLRNYLSVDGIMVSQLSILTTPRPTDKALSASINRKIQAKQDAETSQTLLQQSVADANRKIATAKGDSTVMVINGNAIAEYNKKVQLSLTPAIIQKLAIEKWNGVLPTYTSGNGGMFFNIPTK